MTAPQPLPKQTSHWPYVLVAVLIATLLSATVLVTLLWLRADDLQDIADANRTAVHHFQDSLCNFLLAYQVAPPETAYGRELARRSADLAAQFHCIPERP